METQQKILIKIPKTVDPLGREVLAEMIIQFMKRRTSEGKNVFGTEFQPYSKSYTKSKDFKLANKNPNLVDLQLSGKTVEGLKLLAHRSGQLTIGYEKGTFENDKAAWVSGQGKGPPRNFLGIKKDDLNVIIKKFEDLSSQNESRTKTEARAIFNRLIG